MKHIKSILTILILTLVVAGVANYVLAQKASAHAKAAKSQVKDQIFTVNGVSFIMVAVEGGSFTMGATSEKGTDDPWDDERPTHKVSVSSFSIGQTEVTQELWVAVMGENPSFYNSYGNSKYETDHIENYGINLKRPVECVKWDDCQEFIRRLNAMTGQQFRLPTEAEWEYAARGGDRSSHYKYSGSNTVKDVAWYWESVPTKIYDDSGYGTQTVATKSPNEIGIYDMSGNVWELCSDWFGPYSSSSQTDPRGASSSGFGHMIRGGGWVDDAVSCRVSTRFKSQPDFREGATGLRLAL